MIKIETSAPANQVFKTDDTYLHYVVIDKKEHGDEHVQLLNKLVELQLVPPVHQNKVCNHEELPDFVEVKKNYITKEIFEWYWCYESSSCESLKYQDINLALQMIKKAIDHDIIPHDSHVDNLKMWNGKPVFIDLKNIFFKGKFDNDRYMRKHLEIVEDLDVDPMMFFLASIIEQ